MVEPGRPAEPRRRAGSGADGDAIAQASSDEAALHVHIVALRRRHLRSVMRIEAQVYPRPWSLALFMSELNLRISRVYVAARVGGVVVGYGGIMVADDEAHVTNIAVDPAWHRHKIGTRLLAHLVRATLAQGARHLTLEVRMSNLGAQTLYRNFGFEPAGVRKNYYAETKEDAMVMWAYDLDSGEAADRLAAIEAALPDETIDETDLALPVTPGDQP